MKKIERRAFVCLALALLLAAGLGFFLVKYFLDGGSWASSAFNRHLYNSSGQLASGTVLDRDGDVLSEVVDGQRTYYDNATVRKATLHAVGDLQGNIGTGALNAFADKLTGYSLLNGAFGAQRGNDLYLTIDARYNYTAYEALGGKSGTVAVYNYETGEILCMVSAPSYDPLNVPEDITTLKVCGISVIKNGQLTNLAYKGVKYENGVLTLDAAVLDSGTTSDILIEFYGGDLVIGVTGWAGIAKVVRTEVRRLRTSEYVLAARCMGGGFFHVLWEHLAPNFLSAILFMVVMNVQSAILAESTLSFLGLGLPLEVISWGSMLSLAQQALLTKSWWAVVIPGIFLVATLLSVTLLGNALRYRNSHNRGKI